MAADHELRLLSKVWRSRTIKPLLDVGVAEGWFQDPVHRKLWAFTLEHYTKYSEVPTSVTVKDHWPNQRVLRVEDSLDYCVEEFVKYRRSVLVRVMVTDAAACIEDENDHEAALAVATAGVSQLARVGVQHSRFVDLRDRTTVEAALAEYRSYRYANGLRGLPTGFKTIDRATAGLLPGQLVTVVATPKAGKSTLTLRMAMNLADAGHTAMFNSYEMSNDEQKARYFAMLAHLSHRRLLDGTLSEAERTRLDEVAEDSLNRPGGVVLGEAVNTVAGIAAEIEDRNPDVVFVDGVYLMRADELGDVKEHEKLRYLTQSLKALAMRTQKPIVISTQALLARTSKTNGVQADSIGYSSSFFQDSDTLLGLDWSEVDDVTQRKLKVVQSRVCAPCSVDMTWDWNTAKFEEQDEDPVDGPPPDDRDAPWEDAYAGVA